MNISVIGTGYVGLVTGVCFAEVGNQVLCIDNDPEKLAKLRAGEVPIYEPGLESLFERNVREGRLHFSDSLQEAVEFAELIFLALPTPPQEDGSADLQYVLNVAGQIAELMKEYRIIVNKSTVPVGTADLVRDLMSKRTLVGFDVVSNPEFLREGMAVEDFMKPERVVVGTSSDRVRGVMDLLYKPFMMSGNPVIYMDERSSEMTKYAANALLATKITFMNEIANLCERVGANVDLVRRGVGTDSRIGPRFLFAGVGYGGSCFPKDVQALFHKAAQEHYDFRILDAVMSVNEKQKRRLTEKIQKFFGPDLSGRRVAVWGIAFKPNTDDIREAPALTFMQELLVAGAAVVAFDPEAMNALRKYHPDLNVELAANPYDALKDADALAIVTEWNEFRTPDFKKIKQLLKAPIVFDGRNLYEPFHLEEQGFYYESIGRPTVDGRDE